MITLIKFVVNGEHKLRCSWFSPLRGAERLIHVFTRDRQLNTFWGKSIQATVLLIIYKRSVSVSSFLLLCCRNSFRPSGFAITIWYASVFLPSVLHSLPSSSSFTFLHSTNYIVDATNIITIKANLSLYAPWRFGL